MATLIPPHAKRPRLKEETNKEKIIVSEATKVVEKKETVKNGAKEGMVKARHVSEELLWDLPRATSDADSGSGRKDVESDPGDVSSVESDLGDVRSVESDPGDMRSVESDPGDVNSVESEPGDVSSVESDPGDVSSVESESAGNSTRLSRDPFKTHFEDDLTEKEVDYLEKLYSSPLEYCQVQVCHWKCAQQILSVINIHLSVTNIGKFQMFVIT